MFVIFSYVNQICSYKYVFNKYLNVGRLSYIVKYSDCIGYVQCFIEMVIYINY